MDATRRARIFTIFLPVSGALFKRPSGECDADGIRVNRFLDKSAINNNFKVNNCHITTNGQIASK